MATSKKNTAKQMSSTDLKKQIDHLTNRVNQQEELINDCTKKMADKVRVAGGHVLHDVEEEKKKREEREDGKFLLGLGTGMLICGLAVFAFSRIMRSNDDGVGAPYMRASY